MQGKPARTVSGLAVALGTPRPQWCISLLALDSTSVVLADLVLFTATANTSIVTLNLSLMLNKVGFYQVRQLERSVRPKPIAVKKCASVYATHAAAVRPFVEVVERGEPACRS